MFLKPREYLLKQAFRHLHMRKNIMEYTEADLFLEFAAVRSFVMHAEIEVSITPFIKELQAHWDVPEEVVLLRIWEASLWDQPMRWWRVGVCLDYMVVVPAAHALDGL